MYKTLITVFIILLASTIPNKAQDLYDDGVGQLNGHIPDEYQVRWTDAGLFIEPPLHPAYAWDITDFGADNTGNNDCFNAISAAIDSANKYAEYGYSAVYFPEGMYLINSTIELSSSDSNIVFIGDGYNKTRLHFVLNTNNEKCFKIRGDYIGEGSHKDVDEDISKGSFQIESSELMSIVTIGDWIHYFEKNHPEETGNCNNDLHNSIGQLNMSGVTIFPSAGS